MDQEPQEVIQTKEELVERLKAARKKTINSVRYDEILEEENRAKERYLLGEISVDELNQILDSFEAECAPAIVSVNTVGEFHTLMEALAEIYGRKFNLTPEGIAKVIEHENEHAVALENAGFIWQGYAVMFIRRGSRGIFPLPMVMAREDTSWSPQEWIDKSIEIIGAPGEIEHGHLSRYDEAEINRLKALREKIQE